MPDSSSSARYSGPVWFGYMVLCAVYHGRFFRRHYRPLRDGRTDHLCFLCPHGPRRLALRALSGRVAAAAINVVAKKPDDWAKGIILCGIVEFYAILSLLASVLLLMNAL